MRSRQRLVALASQCISVHLSASQCISVHLSAHTRLQNVKVTLAMALLASLCHSTASCRANDLCTTRAGTPNMLTYCYSPPTCSHTATAPQHAHTLLLQPPNMLTYYCYSPPTCAHTATGPQRRTPAVQSLLHPPALLYTRPARRQSSKAARQRVLITRQRVLITG